MQPATRGDTVRDVSELVRSVDLDEILENGRLDQVRVQLSNTIDLVRSNHSKVCHAYHLRLRFLDDGHIREQLTVLGERALNELQEIQVDVVDDLQMAWQQVLEERDGPLLQCLRQDRVVGVAESLADDVPGIIPVEALNVDENPLQLRNSQGWVGVIELNGDLRWKVLPRPLALLEAADNIVERRGAPEVLLLQAKLLAAVQAAEALA